MSMPGSEDIALPWDGQYLLFNRDRLSTAILEYLEASDKGDEWEKILLKCSQRLSLQHGFSANDAILYPVAARICVERNIEP